MNTPSSVFSTKKNLKMIQMCQICACDHCSSIVECLLDSLWLSKAAGFLPSFLIRLKFYHFSGATASVWRHFYVLVIIFFASASDEEVIFRSFDGDILKVNTHNQTELLMKNTTFVRFLLRCFKCVDDVKFYHKIVITVSYNKNATSLSALSTMNQMFHDCTDPSSDSSGFLSGP